MFKVSARVYLGHNRYENRILLTEDIYKLLAELKNCSDVSVYFENARLSTVPISYTKIPNGQGEFTWVSTVNCKRE